MTHMQLAKRVVTVAFAGGMALAAFGLAAPAAGAATTCANPQATDFHKADGSIDLDAYSAAVAAANACKAGTTTTSGSTASTLAFTGSSSKELAIVGGALVVAGAGAVLITRRRRTST